MLRRAVLVLLVVGLGAAAWLKATRFADSPDATRYFAGFFFLGVAGLALVGSSLARERTRRKRGFDLERHLAGNRRETYRIHYPEGDRPRFGILGNGGNGEPRWFEVLDASEEGIRFRAADGFVPGDEVEGRVEFPTGRWARVQGTVIRVEGDQVGLRLTRTIPGAIIVEETRRLRDHLRPSSSADEEGGSGSTG
ncbi:PilZ domain-containing protein [Deferrisoma palaeochoriense]